MLYVDIDVHHGDGVEEVFLTTGSPYTLNPEVPSSPEIICKIEESTSLHRSCFSHRMFHGSARGTARPPKP